MSVSVVNGYVCYCSCDEAKARAGKNPHPKPGETELSRHKLGERERPAVVYGGRLAPLNAAAPVTTANAVNPVEASLSAESIDLQTAAGDTGVDIFV